MAAAAALGYFMFYGNVSNIYISIITLAFSLLLYSLLNSTSDPKYKILGVPLGGYNGVVGIPQFHLSFVNGGLSLAPRYFLFVCVVVVVALGCVVAAVMRSPYGTLVRAVGSNELRATLLGYDVRLVKLSVFVIGGGIAGMAGGLFAAWARFVSPTVFMLGPAASVLIWVLVGGRTAIVGAFVGTFAVQAASSKLSSFNAEDAPIMLGLIMLLAVLLLPNGLVPRIAGLLDRVSLWRRLKVLVQPEWPVGEDDPSEQRLPRALRRERGQVAADGSPALAAESLVKTFGGLRAVGGVSLNFTKTGVHCLIGPNGAGKSTFFALLSGRERPAEGTVHFGDRDVTRLKTHFRARLGMGVKPQIPAVFPNLTAFENLFLACYATDRHKQSATQEARTFIRWLGFDGVANKPVGELSHGMQQRLEIAMVMSAEPAVILLDEPTAGMTHSETEEIAKLVRQMGEVASVVVVEHDMDFVRYVDAPVTVFHLGEVYISGSLAEIEQNDGVLDMYLGRGHVRG
jgi:branched-chain amino acid transport system permease protein